MTWQAEGVVAPAPPGAGGAAPVSGLKSVAAETSLATKSFNAFWVALPRAVFWKSPPSMSMEP